MRGDDDQGYKVVWSEGDKITINGSEYELIKGEGTTGGEFRGPVKFKNIGGLVRISLRDAFGRTLKSITISASENMAGYINIAQNDVIFIGTSKSVTLDCGDQGTLIINRDDLRACGDQVIGAFANDYPGAGVTELSVGGMKTSGGRVVCKFYVQDKDKYEKDSEWWDCKGKYFEDIADKYFREKDYFTWCANHTSGWCGKYGATMDYNENADKMNNYVANDYIPNHPRLKEKGAWRGLGIVMMDYAGETEYGSHNVYGDVLVKALLDINFATD